MYVITSSHGQPLEEPMILPVKNPEAWKAAEEMGIDIAMLYQNSLLTVDERIANHAAALASVEALERNIRFKRSE